MVGIYPNIPHKAVLETVRRIFIDTSEIMSGMLTGDTVQITEFVLKNKFFEFDGEFKRQNSGTSVDIKFASLYACIFLDKVENEFQVNICNFFYAFIILTIYFSYGLLEHGSWILYLMSLTNFILIYVLLMRHQRKG